MKFHVTLMQKVRLLHKHSEFFFFRETEVLPLCKDKIRTTQLANFKLKNSMIMFHITRMQKVRIYIEQSLDSNPKTSKKKCTTNIDKV